MGDKATARETMRKAGVPTVPGSEGLIEVDKSIDFGDGKRFLYFPLILTCCRADYRGSDQDCP